jgi:hypothetical protein
MNRGCTKSGISTILLLISFACFSQSTSFDTVVFYKHLIAENLLPEQIAFNRQMQKLHCNNRAITDSLLLSLSVAYSKLGNTDSSNCNLNKISANPVFSVTSLNTYLSLLIIGKENDRVNNFLNKYTIQPTPLCFNDAVLSVKILERRPTVQDTDISAISPFLRDIKMRYERPPHYSGFLAGVYSAIIPGMGKLYLGYKEQALSAFIENIALGAQAAESYYRAGYKSARFIITGSLFGLFYGGNIWGSIILAKKQKREHLKQIDYEIFNYYNTGISSTAK